MTRSINRERPGITKMEQRSMKPRKDATLVKMESLFIHTEDERHEKTPHAAAALSIMFFLVCKPLTIQATKMWSQQFNSVTYYRWNIGATTTPYYWIVIDALSMSEDT